MDLVILMELKKRSLSGHDVIDFAQRKFRIMLALDTVSTNLSALEKEGLITAEDSQGKTVYTLTERGKETISEISNSKDKILGLFLNLFVGE